MVFCSTILLNSEYYFQHPSLRYCFGRPNTTLEEGAVALRKDTRLLFSNLWDLVCIKSEWSSPVDRVISEDTIWGTGYKKTELLRLVCWGTGEWRPDQWEKWTGRSAAKRKASRRLSGVDLVLLLCCSFNIIKSEKCEQSTDVSHCLLEYS